VKFSFTKRNRLKDKEISCLIKRAKKISGKRFILYADKNRLSFCRVAISVSHKNIKLPSKRNLIRRRIKTSLMETQRKALPNIGFDIFIVVKTKEVPAYEVITKEIVSLLKQVK
jgi:ribonuclease P protein component